MRSLVSFIVGALFGLGLLISGMTDTTKVQGWLDIFGDWDPTLANAWVSGAWVRVPLISLVANKLSHVDEAARFGCARAVDHVEGAPDKGDD